MLLIQRTKNLSWITEGVTFLFIILFFYAGFSKLIDGNSFYNNLNNSPVLVGSTIASIAEWIVPLAELLVGFLLFWPKTRVKGMVGVITLLLLFTAYIVAILFFSPYIPCSCGGVIAQLSWEQHLIFNILCIGLAAFNLWLLMMQSNGFGKAKNLFSKPRNQ